MSETEQKKLKNELANILKKYSFMSSCTATGLMRIDINIVKDSISDITITPPPIVIR